MQHAQQLGRYHLLDRVAFGGMAEIYRAKTADGQGQLHLVAVKRVLAHLCEDDEFIQMLIDEARLTAMLKHPNIARVYEFCRTAKEYFIAMEFVDGKDLRALLEKARQNQEWLPEEQIAYVCMQVARALHSAHIQTDRAGNPLKIVHRDVSPSNVLLSYDGEVKLCDFGIAKATSSRSQTKTGVIKGKVKYMSPEQAMGRNLDRRSDLFSLGTLLYEMLALQAPFAATTEIELLFAVRDARMRPILEVRPHLNADLNKIIDTAMAKSREKRFQSGEEFAGALEAFLDTHYPNYGVSQLARYLHKTFERERDKEQKSLDEFIIEGGSAESVGENLLADVLGPDAEYTQFTAAFSQMTAGQLGMAPSAASLSNAPNPMHQMRVMSSVSMPGIEDLDSLPTQERQRLPGDAFDLNIPETIPFSNSAQTVPRSAGGGGRVASEADNATAILNERQMPRSTAGNRQSDPTQIVGDGQPRRLYDDGLHGQETHILSRDQVDALLARRGIKQPAAPAPASANQAPRVFIEPQALAAEPELHEASTQILSMDSLPQNIRELLQAKAGGGTATAKPAAAAPARSPTAVTPALPSLKLQPLDADFHEQATAYLDWSPVELTPQDDLPMPDPSLVAPVRPPAPLPRTTAAVQPPPPALPAPAPRSTAPAGPAGRSPVSTVAPTVPRTPPTAAPALGSASLAPPLITPRPVTAPPVASPPPALSTPRPAINPQLGSPRPAPQSPLRATAPPAASPQRLPEPPLPPPRLAGSVPPPQVVTSAVGAEQSDEWEALPHLESTMIARGALPIDRPPPRLGGAFPARHDGPSRFDPASRPDQRSPEPPGRQEPPLRPTLAAAPRVELPAERTVNSEEGSGSSGGQFDDLPTPVKDAPALRDLGIAAESDFAEDTSKGGLPRGLSEGAHNVDPSGYLSDDDIESVD
jgi:serine/threonine-protein kinase